MKTRMMSELWISLLERLNIGAFTIDARRRITFINDRALRLFSLDEEDVVGRECRQVFKSIPCFDECPFHEESASKNADLEIVDRGRDLLVTRVATPLFDHRRRMVGCLTTLQDHSPFADLVNRIKYEERSLKIILDNLDIGVLTVNRGGYVTFFNTAAELISGFDRREILGKSWKKILNGDDFRNLAAWLETEAPRKKRAGALMRLISRQGEDIPVRAEYMPLINEKQTTVGSLITFTDLTLINQLSRKIQDRYSFHDIIGKSPAMQKIFAMVNVVAPTDATLLIEGATGTGKDLLAGVIHGLSKRADKPFVKVNCASLPENLLESELFGYSKGAFTGAVGDKPGRFQDADGGTIFLDEIGDLHLPLQAKLLRVIEDREFYPLGSRHTVKVDVRIISATNRGLENMVRKRTFREDLFYRLNVVRIELPPLKNRTGDLPLIIHRCLRCSAAAKGMNVPEISGEAIEILLNYTYPGNIREVENILEHALIVCQGRRIEKDHLPLYMLKYRPAGAQRAAGAQPELSRDEDLQRILQMLGNNNWHKAKTAKALGMDRTTLWRKLAKMGL